MQKELVLYDLPFSYASGTKAFYTIPKDGRPHIIGRNPPKEGIRLKLPTNIQKEENEKSYQHLITVYGRVSKEHAALINDNGKIFVEPRRSTHPTFVQQANNGDFEEIEKRTQLFRGDMIGLGQYRLKLIIIDRDQEKGIEGRLVNEDTDEFAFEVGEISESIMKM
ncbi:MAG: hypothetical protein RL557_248 [archaeon]|jgi:pSer/pThr/pTyr-binding forkhead associated (FHA) protein